MAKKTYAQLQITFRVFATDDVVRTSGVDPWMDDRKVWEGIDL